MAARRTGAKPGRVYRLAVVITAGRDELPTLAFFDELRVQGFVEGKNLEIIPDGFRIRNEQAATVVSATVKAAPDAIVSAGDFITQKFHEATKSIPLIAMTEDMVAAGFAASLAKPGGNITGISLMSPIWTASDRTFSLKQYLMHAGSQCLRFQCRNVGAPPSFGNLSAFELQKGTAGRPYCKRQRARTGH